MKIEKNGTGPIFNCYPDSIGGKLSDIVSLLKKDEFKDVFKGFYILPSVFNSDLDRGFSLINYELQEQYATNKDIEDLHSMNIELMLDFILNHISVNSFQFQDIIKNGENSIYKDFFINWNKFWDGYGTKNEKGYIVPDEKYIKDMFFRKPGLPILMVRYPDGKDMPYWNTFYQEIIYKKIDTSFLVSKLNINEKEAKTIAHKINDFIDSKKSLDELDLQDNNRFLNEIKKYLEDSRNYLGQMDLNIKSDLVWEYYKETLEKLAGYGASLIRLDAFAYTSKEVGARNFMNEPGTWNTLSRIKEIADGLNLTLLPEIHASYYEKVYELLANKGYVVYDFFLPGLLIDAFERKNGTYIKKWADEIIDKNINTVNMLGCHDGIPLLDLKGLLNEEDIRKIIDVVVKRGGYVKDLHGAKDVYYQVNATYYSALGESNKRMLIARAIQMFMPGKPQIWYLDLFAGKNDYEAMKKAGIGGHKEINRTNLSLDKIEKLLKEDIVIKQLELIRFRNTNPAFSTDAKISINVDGSKLSIEWKNEVASATLYVDFINEEYSTVSKCSL